MDTPVLHQSVDVTRTKKNQRRTYCIDTVSKAALARLLKIKSQRANIGTCGVLGMVEDVYGTMSYRAL